MQTERAEEILRLMEEYNLALVPVRVYADESAGAHTGRTGETRWAVTSPEAQRCCIVGDSSCTGWLEDCWQSSELFATPTEAIQHYVAVLREMRSSRAVDAAPSLRR